MSHKIFNELDSHLLQKRKDQNLSNIKLNALKFKKISVGRSGSSVYYMEIKGKKYILKYDNDSKNFRQEILIHLEITENTRSTLLPNMINYGFLKGDGIIYNSNYLYYITDYIEGFSIRQLYESPRVISIKALKYMYITLLDEYAYLNQKLGFIHSDIKSDNLIFDKKNLKLRLIDLGLASTTKYKYSTSRQIIKKRIEFPLKHYIYPFKDINKTSFNYVFSNITFSRSKAYKSLQQLNTSNIDIINIIKLYNTGIRIIFYNNNRKKEIILTDKDISALNTKKELFYKKLNYTILLLKNN